MYIELVRKILETAVEKYAANNGKTVSEVLGEIRDHIDRTSSEHRKDEPEIDYKNPLCRLGYLYRHATANATLFEHVLIESGKIRQILRESETDRLEMCTVGGGPGTELLGVAKYLIRRAFALKPPEKMIFTVLDSVPEWSEIWSQLSDAVESELKLICREAEVTPTTIAPQFLPLDVGNVESFRNFAFQFERANIVVFNYLFSENKSRLDEIKETIIHLSSVAPSGCLFVVIDRHESDPSFTNEVVDIFKGAFSKDIDLHKFDGTLDYDEQTEDMGKMLIDVLGRPRIKFFTPEYRDPTVFWFAIEK